MAQKRSLFETLILSPLLYGTESLILSKPAECTYAEAALRRLYRRLLRNHPSQHISNLEVRARAELPDFPTLVRRTRLRYYATILRRADLRTGGILQDETWKSAVETDLVWMWQHLLLANPLLDPHIDLLPWHDLTTARPGYWKKLVNRAVRHHVLRQQHTFEVDSFHQRFGTQMQNLDLLRVGLPSPVCCARQPSKRKQEKAPTCSRLTSKLQRKGIYSIPRSAAAA